MANKTLSEAQLARQGERGIIYRNLMNEATKDFLDIVKNPVILLSGGIDSCSTLWAMLDNGVRPGVITYSVPTATKPSTDSLRAQKLAAYYDLPFHNITVTGDPDEVAKGTESIVRGFYNMTGRADIEVLFLFDQLFAAAVELGYDSVFSGISDGALHLLGRELEIRGRSGLLPTPASDWRRLDGLDDNQFGPLNCLALNRGLSFCDPLFLVAHQLPYSDLDWDLLNLPHNKAITRRAYQKEIDETGMAILVQPMQTGDSGAREYFDTMISKSNYAREVAGRETPTGKVYYNSLVKQEEFSDNGVVLGQRRKPKSEYPILLNRILGFPIPDDYEAAYQYDENGRALNPPVVEPDEDDLFGDLTEPDEEIFLDEDGKPDSRTDCWGHPFWGGPTKAFTGCARAQAGLCSKPNVDPNYDYTKCTRLGIRYDELLEGLDIIVGLYTDKDHPVGAVYAQWAVRTEARKVELQNREAAPERVS